MAIDTEFFFASVNATDSTFLDSYARQDFTVLGFSFGQIEGEFATLTLTIKPETQGITFLSAGKKQWLWFSYRQGTDIVPRFFGRMDALQTVSSDDGNVIVIDFIAEPQDFLNQKKTVADSLRVLPNYDRVFIDEQSWDDDDIVIEGYPVRYHFDPVTHEISTSNLLIGEDGVEDFTVSDMRFGGFSQGLSSKPSKSVTVTGRLNWTQRGQGTVDLSSYFISNWPGAVNGAITSYTFQQNSWPGVGSSIGSGWNVLSSSCDPVYDLTVKTTPFGSKTLTDWSAWGASSEEGDDGVLPTTNTTGNNKTEIDISGSDESLKTIPPDSISLPRIPTDLNVSTQFDRDGQVSSYSRSESSVEGLIALNYLRPSLVAQWKANRSQTEVVSLTLTADIQPVIGAANQGQNLEPINLESADLSDTMGIDTDAETPMDDARGRSYICTDRGQQSLQYMIARGNVALIQATRCVETTFSPYFDRMADVTLRKNARVHRGEIPGGSCEGKIIAYRMEMQRGVGRIDCSVTIASAIGRGGEITEVAGSNTYVEDDFIEAGHFEESGVVELFDSSIGYEPPLFNPNDDGLDLINGFTANDAFETALSVTNSGPTQKALIEAGLSGYREPFMPRAIPAFVAMSPLWLDYLNTAQEVADGRETFVNNVLAGLKTTATFKLKPMNRSFESDYEITTYGPKIPTMINLEV